VVCQLLLGRDSGNCNIGSVLSLHDIGLMEAVKLRKKEGSSLLLRYTISKPQSVT
jgi:hypothetical protein